MKHLQTMTEWINEQESLNEDAMINVDILLDAEPGEVEAELKGMDGISDVKVTDFGVIKLKSKRKNLGELKRMKGVSSVETF